MTEETLSQYRAIQDEIKLLENKIKETQNEKDQVLTDSVKGSSKSFPYIACNFNISGINPDAKYIRQERVDRLKRKREKKKIELVEKELEIHDFIYSISDSTDRQIFILRFVEGLGYTIIGRKLHLDRTTVAKRIKKYLEERKDEIA